MMKSALLLFRPLSTDRVTAVVCNLTFLWAYMGLTHTLPNYMQLEGGTFFYISLLLLTAYGTPIGGTLGPIHIHY